MKRYGSMFLFIIIIYFIQLNIFPQISVITVSPNLLLILVVGYGLIFGKKAGMISGLMAGLLMDIMFAHTIGYYTVPYMYIGFFNGILNAYFNYDNFIIPSICCAVSELFINFYIFVFSFALRNRLHLGFYLEHIIVPEMIYTVVISLILFRLQAYVNQKVMIWEKRRGVKIV